MALHSMRAIECVWRPVVVAAMVRPPSDRWELVVRDIVRGYISEQSAHQDYGVTIRADGKGYRP